MQSVSELRSQELQHVSYSQAIWVLQLPATEGWVFSLKLLHLMFSALEVPGSVPVVLTKSSAVTQKLANTKQRK